MSGNQLAIDCGFLEVCVVKSTKVQQWVAKSVGSKARNIVGADLSRADQLCDEGGFGGRRLRQEHLRLSLLDSAGLDECACKTAQR